jgi:hydrogenase 3 maturation protease
MTRRRDGFEATFARRLRGAGRIAVVGIGDEARRADRLGIDAARQLEALRLPGLRVFVAGTVPESFTAPVRRFRPGHVVLIDAADMGLRPGSVAIVEPSAIASGGSSTHRLPLPALVEFLEASLKRGVTLVGLQPDLDAAGDGLTAAEEAGLTHLVAAFQRIVGSRARTSRPSGR